MRIELKVLMAVLVALVAILAVTSESAEADEGDSVMIDMGNGETYWYLGESSGTLDTVLSNALTSFGMTYSSSGTVITVDGRTSVTVTGSVDVTTMWRFYQWTEGAWADLTDSFDGSTPYSGTVALGFYPAGTAPVETPDHMNSWTMVRGDAIQSGNQTSTAFTQKAVLTYVTSPDDNFYVCGVVLVAGDRVYVPSANSSPSSEMAGSCLYCFDRFTGEEIWKFLYPSGVGYETASGLIVGEYIYMPATNGYLYKVPLAGPGDMEYSVCISSNIILDSERNPGVTSVEYRAAGSSEYISVDKTQENVDVYYVPVAIGNSYDVRISATGGVVYTGTLDVDATGSQGVSLHSTTSSDIIPDQKFSIDVTYADVSGLYIQKTKDHDLSGRFYATAAASPVFDNGVIYFASNNGYIYCTDLDLNVVWKTPIDGCVYYFSPTVSDGLLYIGALNGHLYIIDALDGSILKDEVIYQEAGGNGGVSAVTEIDGTLFFSWSDGKGMNAAVGGVAVYRYDRTANVLTQVTSVTDYGLTTNYLLRVVSDDFTGVYLTGSKAPLCRLSVDGTGEVLNTDLKTIKAGLVLVNGTDIYADEYHNTGSVLHLDLEGNELASIVHPKDARNFCMSSPVILDGYIYCANDGGFYFFKGDLVSEPGFTVEYSISNGTATVTSDGEAIESGAKVAVGAKVIFSAVADEGYAVKGWNINGTAYDTATYTLESIDKDVEATALIEQITYTVSFEQAEGGTIHVTCGGAEVRSGDALPPGSAVRFEATADDGYSVGEWTVNGADMGTSDIYILNLQEDSVVALEFVPDVAPSAGSDYHLWYIALALIVILFILLAFWFYRRSGFEGSFVGYVSRKIKGEAGGSRTKHNKRRLSIVIVLGIILTFFMFLCTLSFGPYGTLSIPDAFSALISAIQKGGNDLTDVEIIVYESRLPRAIAALGVGIGLSVAGCVYQAVIRNPLVDPYIMGVSSGAGTFAVAAIASNFTFFGLLAGNDYATPILAIVGGLLAFGLTMLIAEKAGSSSSNYVLAGVVVGLAFSAVQTILMVTADSTKLQSAISWLFGSFANIGWDTVWLVFFPALFLALTPLIWAKEMNVVLLGEDQAQQMGINVKRFNRLMLILASVLTSVCVAFVGIIGFVGLVIPHMCRMVLGGDHRLVLPASIAMGGALMLFADLLAKTIMVPQELPVGAITTLVGVPVFAYLLIKKGRMYDG